MLNLAAVVKDPVSTYSTHSSESNRQIKEENSRFTNSSQKKIENPHDKMFKETFGHVEVTKSFLQHYLPQNFSADIDFDTLKPEKDSFINDELEEGFSDLLFQAYMNGRKGYIYLLFEHKSYPDKTTAFQLLKYMAEIWMTKMRKEKMNRVPIILPLIIYHGVTEWDATDTLGGMVEDFEFLSTNWQRIIPDFQYFLYDITSFTDEEIRGEARVRILFTMFRDIQQARNADEVIAVIEKGIAYLKELEDEQSGIKYFETFMRYIFSAAKNLSGDDTEKIVQLVERNYTEGSEIVMTLADILREEGKLEGIEEGKQKKGREVAKFMLEKGMEIQFIEEATSLSREEIARIKNELGI